MPKAILILKNTYFLRVCRRHTAIGLLLSYHWIVDSRYVLTLSSFFRNLFFRVEEYKTSRHHPPDHHFNISGYGSAPITASRNNASSNTIEMDLKPWSK